MKHFRGKCRWLRPLEYLKDRFRFHRVQQTQVGAGPAASRAASGDTPEIAAPAGGSFPRLMDLYILRRFLYYFALLMAIFVFLYETFTLFDLFDDIARHKVPFLIVVDYFRYLTPFLLYNFFPLLPLLAVLVPLGLILKH